MKTRFAPCFVVLVVFCLVIAMAVAVAEEDEFYDELHWDRFYVTLPEIDLRANPDTPGRIDTLYAGDEVEFLNEDGIWATFEYQKDGETKTGCTWIGAISPAVRIHLLEDAFVFRVPENDREDFGLISCWREPTDPDLLILWEYWTEEGNIKWYFVVSLEDCRSGYMLADTAFEVVIPEE